MFKVQFETTNAAFDDDPAGAVVGILGDIIDKLEDGERSGEVLDENGNPVGTWELAHEPRLVTSETGEPIEDEQP